MANMYDGTPQIVQQGGQGPGGSYLQRPTNRPPQAPQWFPGQHANRLWGGIRNRLMGMQTPFGQMLRDQQARTRTGMEQMGRWADDHVAGPQQVPQNAVSVERIPQIPQRAVSVEGIQLPQQLPQLRQFGGPPQGLPSPVMGAGDVGVGAMTPSAMPGGYPQGGPAAPMGGPQGVPGAAARMQQLQPRPVVPIRYYNNLGQTRYRSQ